MLTRKNAGILDIKVKKRKERGRYETDGESSAED